MEFKDLLDWCKAEAIANTLVSNEISVWRKLCRDYSERFSTPLHMCLDGTIPAEDMLLAVFEDQLKSFDPETDLDAMMEQIYRIEDPDYDEKADEELQDFMAKAAEEEAERIRLGKPIHKALKQEVQLGKNTSEKKSPETPKKSGGMINLAYLQREEMNQSGGFE